MLILKEPIMKLRNSVILLSVFAFGLMNCTQESDVIIGGGGGGNDQPQTYLFVTDLAVNHKVGDTSCPQLMGMIEIAYGGINDKDNSIPDTDSVSVQNTHSSINGYFNTWGVLNASVDDTLQGFDPFTVEFNCAKAESVNSQITFSFFNNGMPVATESVGLKVTVNQ